MANGFYIGDNRKQRYGKVFQNNRKDSIWNCSTGNVKKNVTIPQWLDILAKENKVNYSAALVKGIKSMLGIEY